MKGQTIGDLFRSRITGTEYELRKIMGHMAVLHSLDGRSHILTGMDSLDLFYEKQHLPGNQKETYDGKG